MDSFQSSPPAAVIADIAALRASPYLSGIPPKSLPCMIFQDPDEGHFYGQIAWFISPSGESRLKLPRDEHLAGNFDFRPALRDRCRTSQLADLRPPVLGQLLAGASASVVG